MWAAITDSEVLAINIKNTDGASADFDDFTFTGRNFVWGCDYVFRHVVVREPSAISHQRSVRVESIGKTLVPTIGYWFSVISKSRDSEIPPTSVYELKTWKDGKGGR